MDYIKGLIIDMLTIYFVIFMTLTAIGGAAWIAYEVGLTDITCTRNEAK